MRRVVNVRFAWKHKEMRGMRKGEREDEEFIGRMIR